MLFKYLHISMKTFIRTRVTHHPRLPENERLPETLNLKFENWDSPRQICAFCPGMRAFPGRWHFSANTETSWSSWFVLMPSKTPSHHLLLRIQLHRKVKGLWGPGARLIEATHWKSLSENDWQVQATSSQKGKIQTHSSHKASRKIQNIKSIKCSKCQV